MSGRNTGLGRRVATMALSALLAAPMALGGVGCSRGELYEAATGNSSATIDAPTSDPSPHGGATLETYESPEFDPTLPQGDASLEASNAAWAGDEQGFWHAHLDGRARKLYDNLYPHYAARDTDFELGSMDELFEQGSDVLYIEDDDEFDAVWDAFWDDFDVALKAIEYDHPELFWLDAEGTNSWGEVDWVKNADGWIVGLRLGGVSYGMEEDKIADTQDKLDAAVEEAVAAIPGDGTDYECAWAAYEWLTKRVEYDVVTIQADAAKDKELADKLTAKYQGADSALVGGVSVCAGYSRAYQLILSRLGIPCTYVRGLGDPLDPESSHAWNLVCLGGRYGYVDVTWGDIVEAGQAFADESAEDKGEVYTASPLHFFMTDADMAYDGRVADEDFLPLDEGEQGTHPYAALLPACDNVIWEDDRYEPSVNAPANKYHRHTSL